MRPQEYINRFCHTLHNGELLPNQLPTWAMDLGIIPGSIVTSIRDIGGIGGKTDIIITFNQGNSLKISAKLSNADYFGNWYSHDRIIREFGHTIFYSLTNSFTNWANNWINNPHASFFIGASICFGRRQGNTAKDFTDIFSLDDIISIVAGHGHQNNNANCLLEGDAIPRNINELIQMLNPINNETILRLSRNFKVIVRPINPMRERSNRGKCIYTQFRPNFRYPQLTEINNIENLREIGTFITVSPNGLNHNKLIALLATEFNIRIPTK